MAIKNSHGPKLERWQLLVGVASLLVAIISVLITWPSHESPANQTSTSSPSSGPSTTSTSLEGPTSTSSDRPTAVEEGPSKDEYLLRAEQICQESPGEPAGPMPDRWSSPQAFAGWLNHIAKNNQANFDRIGELTMPPEEAATLRSLLAQRRHANEVYQRAASAFGREETQTGEQFLQSAIQIEAEFRENARAYGFSVCIGSDTPGR